MSLEEELRELLLDRLPVIAEHAKLIAELVENSLWLDDVIWRVNND